MGHQETRSLRALGSTPLGLALSFVFPLAAGAMLGMSLLSLAARPIWADQTWNLFAAGRVLDGARLGFEDVAEVNLPLIIWLCTIPAATGRVLGIPLTVALQGWVTALVAFSVTWSTILLRRDSAADASGSRAGSRSRCCLQH